MRLRKELQTWKYERYKLDKKYPDLGPINKKHDSDTESVDETGQDDNESFIYESASLNHRGNRSPDHECDTWSMPCTSQANPTIDDLNEDDNVQQGPKDLYKAQFKSEEYDDPISSDDSDGVQLLKQMTHAARLAYSDGINSTEYGNELNSACKKANN